jgi:mitochondrial Rho GTPase 1
MPIILVGNKLDKKELEIDVEREYTNIRSILKAITKKYRQVQMGLECSAYYDRNVKKVLNCSQRAVLYPLTPLYDLNTKELTPKFKKAAKRIFRILDKDLDGRLSDNELRSLQ